MDKRKQVLTDGVKKIQIDNIIWKKMIKDTKVQVCDTTTALINALLLTAKYFLFISLNNT